MKRAFFTYSGVIYSKKNSKSIIRNSKTGKSMLISSKRARQMESDMVEQFSYQKGLGYEPPKGRVAITIWIFRKDNTKRDLDNMTSSIMDGLVRAGIILDDDFKHVGVLKTIDGGVDKLNPRAIAELHALGAL